ncbi:MAG: alpha-E domain-containing protein [Verrucomicrobiota bacterium]
MMLCRVADSLFWMSRYMERAENTARMVEANLQLMLDSQTLGLGPVDEFWSPILGSMGDDIIFNKQYDQMNNQNVMDFLVFNRKNSSSVLSCVIAARENARMVRDQISDEMWEITNRLYHMLFKSSSYAVGHSELYDQLRQVREFSNLLVGATEGTYNHGTGYLFIKAGRFLERVEKTGRMLDSKKHLFLFDEADSTLIINLEAVLRACSASTAYQQTYDADLTLKNVLQLMILSREFPRSMLFSMNELQLAIHGISQCPITHFSNEAERMCGLMISKLNYASVEEIIKSDAHTFLMDIHHMTQKLTLKLSREYMFFDIVDPAAEAVSQ